jgi:hypothetical protein
MRRVKPSLPAFADALTATFPGPDDAPLAQALLRRLAHGEPVSAIELAAATDGEESEASGALTRWPNLSATNTVALWLSAGSVSCPLRIAST